jgi:HEAT repeat protein
MKNDTRQLLRDLKTATMLGNPEAVNIALDGLLAFPGVAANDRMNKGFIEKTILPVGQALTPLKTSQLRPLLNHELAAGRAIGAVALAHQFIQGKDATAKDLRKPANDPRQDVRISLGRALLGSGDKAPEKLLNLGTPWLMNAAPKPRYTALIFIPALAESHGQRVVGLLGPLGNDPDRDVRAALVEALNALAQVGLAESVLELLSLWAAEAHPNSWVISRALSASWSADHPAESTSILKELSSKPGTTSQVSSAVEALARHGVEIDIT